MSFKGGDTVDEPDFERRPGQFLYQNNEEFVFMDMESYESFEEPMPSEEGFEGKVEQGIQIEYWIVMGRKKLIRRR